MEDVEGEREEDEIRIVLVGRTGSGKSATGNTILGFEKFTSKPSGSSITKTCQRVESQYKGRKLVLVDTPGLFDTNLKPGEVIKEIIKCIEKSKPGPHLFLLVLRCDRFTNEERQTFEQFFDIFGEKMKEFAIIIFTRMDDLERQNVSLRDFIESSNDDLKKLVVQCKRRCIGFNNNAPKEQQEELVSKFFKSVNDVIKNHNNEHYTNEMYQEAEAHWIRKEEAIKQQKDMEKAREVEQIESKYKDEIETLKNERDQAEQQIHELYANNYQDVFIKMLEFAMKHDSQMDEQSKAKIHEQIETMTEKLATQNEEIKKINDQKKYYERKLDEKKDKGSCTIC